MGTHFARRVQALLWDLHQGQDLPGYQDGGHYPVKEMPCPVGAECHLESLLHV